ncbi:MAG: glycine cleavage system protein GcvH [Ilumatobacteraceae bacterium]|nr:glycine cleavage system protein GcvH [Ilumatobacteraceae bacterium]
MNIPEDLRYSADHEWARLSGNSIRIGITDYAQDALGDVVFVQIPMVGAVVALGQSFSEVESTKSVSDIYAPLSGKVSQVNDALVQSPELLNSDPYGDGWICEIELSDPAQFEQLLTSSAYQSLIGG